MLNKKKEKKNLDESKKKYAMCTWYSVAEYTILNMKWRRRNTETKWKEEEEKKCPHK